jgi:hypothetical protein
VNVTLSFAQTPQLLRESLRPWSYFGLVRQSIVGLPVALAGVVLVAWRIDPGAAGGWGVLLTISGVAALALPQTLALSSLLKAARKARTAPRLVEITLTDDHVGYAQDGYSAQFLWRNVADVRETARSWIITTRLGAQALVLPKSAVPAASLPEVTQFLAQWRARAQVR